MLSRPLVYTALTRAQRHLSVVHAAGPGAGARGARGGRRYRDAPRFGDLLARASGAEASRPADRMTAWS